MKIEYIENINSLYKIIKEFGGDYPVPDVITRLLKGGNFIFWVMFLIILLLI